MPLLKVGEGDPLEPVAYEPPALGPYISTDRADIIRLLGLIDPLIEEVKACPINGKVTQDQFLRVRDAVWTLQSLARRVKGRIDAT